MEQNNKTYIRPIIIVMLFAFLTIGYAYLTSALNINGSSLIKTSIWDVHFENIQVMDGSVTGEQVTEEPTIVNDTTVEFHVNLKKPGDYYEFTVDAVNAGTVDAMIDTDVEFTVPVEFQDYIETTATYVDGEEIIEHQQLLAGDTATFKVKVLFKTDLDPDDLPDNSSQLDLDYTVGFIQGDSTAIERRAEIYSLYNVLRKEAESGSGLALKYTGVHQDSMDASRSIKDIYHWYDSTTYGTSTIPNKNNVIFANHCWQMIRTTDTGGVKLIYNGEVDNNQCLDTRGTHVGYEKTASQNMASNYYYGTDYTYDGSTQTFRLSGTTEQATWSSSSGPGLVGKYTCKSANVGDSCSVLYLVESYKNSTNANVTSLKSNTHYSQFGTIEYNINYTSPAYAGYMYNTVYTSSQKAMTNLEGILSPWPLSTSYWYADSISWESNRYVLNNPYQISSTDDYASLQGKYTFFNTSQTYTAQYVSYLAFVESNATYHIQLRNDTGFGHDLNSYNHTYTYGNSYTDNGDGTYTINNPSTIDRFGWYTDYNNVTNKYVCKNAVNNTCSDVWYATKTTYYDMTHIKSSNTYKYSKGFTWDGSKYKLDNNTSTSFWNIVDSTNKNRLSNAHYTCWNTTGECTTLNYVYYFRDYDSSTYYINLTGGKDIETALNEMLYANNVNNTNSTIKTGIDAWYKKYLLSYDNYIEDTIYCVDRTQNNSGSNGLNPNGGSISTQTNFGADSLTCSNVTDRYSTQNDKARLSYKVGLLSHGEAKLLHGIYILKSGNTYWFGSPSHFALEKPFGNAMHRDGNYCGTDYQGYNGLRPVISLKPGTVYTTGDGSKTNPYVIDTN